MLDAPGVNFIRTHYCSAEDISHVCLNIADGVYGPVQSGC